ncbi:hypothetical protein DXG01_013059 [Tephrocybe rancida]|nr:hypothetical protein DXG01_013059 [Tephrocybe rancida]
MLHFPSSTYSSPNPSAKSAPLPNRTDSLKLNATQQKVSSQGAIFNVIEEELHDARRVHSHGQEEDLRAALGMVCERLSGLSTMLGEAYKTSADLEVQLNVAKSNLALVSANNEMLEDALKQRDSTTQNVGWRRTSGRAYSTDDALQHAGDQTPTDTNSPAQESSRFFKFRFTPGGGASVSHPGSPAIPGANLNSPSLPALGVVKERDRERDKEREKELEKELEEARRGREAAKKEKEALEEELESLSQALFEEANKMVASERIRRADVEEELREAKLEKDALRSALRLLEGQATPALPSAPSSPPAPAPNDSPVITLSPTTVAAHVAAQELPPSLQNTATAMPKRAPPPPPAPLSVPTTPFDYDATFNDTGATPTPRPDTTAPAPPASAAPTTTTAPQTSSSTPEEENEVQRVMLPTPSPETKVESKANEPKVDEPKVDELKEETKENPAARRPPSLDLLPHEHDPWADAPSSSKPERHSVMGGTV